MMAGTPATVGDLAHIWLLSHPPQKEGKANGMAGIRSSWGSSGASRDALDFWLK